MYSLEARNKWYQYPPPYNGGYATPWAWVDGKSASYTYNGWSARVGARVSVPTDVSLTVTGSYNPANRQGTLRAVVFNGGMSALSNVALQVAVTEDSINFTGPNGDPWHNHVLRDYVPNQNGTALTLPSAGYDTVDIAYTLASNWVERKCKLVLYVQSSVSLSDSTRPVHQGYIRPVLDFTGVEEPSVPPAFYRNLVASVGPNPVRSAATFRIAGPDAEPFLLGIYSPDGRLVRELRGTLVGSGSELRWDRRDRNGRKVGRGVYAWRVSATDAACSGKLIVAD